MPCSAGSEYNMVKAVNQMPSKLRDIRWLIGLMHDNSVFWTTSDINGIEILMYYRSDDVISPYVHKFECKSNGRFYLKGII